MKPFFKLILLSIGTLSFRKCTVSSFSISPQVVHPSPRLTVTDPTGRLTGFPQPLIHLPTLSMSTQDNEEVANKKSSLPFLLDPGTKGGALFLSLVLFIIPIIGYEITVGMGIDGVEAGRWIGVGFTVITLILWAASYVFRVATKDMTYVSVYSIRFVYYCLFRHATSWIH
jgi:hypothetical protein